jgi:serine/threonine protein kinase
MKVAVKQLRDNPTRQASQAFIREATRISHLNHSNVIKLLGVCFRAKPLLIVLEHMALGDVKSLLRQLKPKEDGGEGPLKQGWAMLK